MAKQDNGFNWVDGEVMDARIQSVSRDIAHVREIMDERQAANHEALVVARNTIAEHLQLLNHEAARILQIQNAMMPKDTAELKFEGIGRSLTEIKVWMGEQKGVAKQTDVSRATAISLVALVGMLISMLLNVLQLLGR